MKKIIIALAALCLTFAVSAQEVQETQTKSYKRGFQLSFISPIGTNGIESNLYTNAFSLNILGGYSSANTIFELASLYNINTKFTSGLQIAGLINYTKDTRYLMQIAGINNIATEANGVQIAGLNNIAKEVNGVQVAGLVNIAKEVNGAQVASIFNYTDKLNGAQFGLINVVNDSKNGAPIGLINIARKGGKYEFEIGVSETLNTSVGFKFGTDHFYTILSAGANYLHQPINYAAGLGFGTHIDWTEDCGNQIEAIVYALSEGLEFDASKLNLLTQLRFTFSKQFGNFFKVYAGPVVNLTISQYTNPNTGELGSSLAPWSLWQNDSDKTRLNAWLGLVIGIRI